jgi:hypothetical protein
MIPPFFRNGEMIVLHAHFATGLFEGFTFCGE